MGEPPEHKTIGVGAKFKGGHRLIGLTFSHARIHI
jgi:hypothetical protein